MQRIHPVIGEVPKHVVVSISLLRATCSSVDFSGTFSIRPGQDFETIYDDYPHPDQSYKH